MRAPLAIVVGIDVGYRVSAMSLVDVGGPRPELLECGDVRTKGEVPDEQARRIIPVELRKLLTIWLSRRAVVPVAVGIEDYTWQGASSANAHAFNTCKLVGAIEHEFSDHTTLVISKRECNLAIGLRYGKGEDRDIKAALIRIFGCKVGRNEHQRDAIVVAHATGKRWRIHASRRVL